MKNSDDSLVFKKETATKNWYKELWLLLFRAIYKISYIYLQCTVHEVSNQYFPQMTKTTQKHVFQEKRVCYESLSSLNVSTIPLLAYTTWWWR